MEVTLPDGTQLTLADGATGADAAAAIGSGLARAALAVEVDGELRDLSRPLPDGSAHQHRHRRAARRRSRSSATTPRTSWPPR